MIFQLRVSCSSADYIFHRGESTYTDARSIIVPAQKKGTTDILKLQRLADCYLKKLSMEVCNVER